MMMPYMLPMPLCLSAFLSLLYHRLRHATLPATDATYVNTFVARHAAGVLPSMPLIFSRRRRHGTCHAYALLLSLRLAIAAMLPPAISSPRYAYHSAFDAIAATSATRAITLFTLLYATHMLYTPLDCALFTATHALIVISYDVIPARGCYFADADTDALYAMLLFR